MFALRSTPRVEVRGATVTSDARLLLRRELSERLGLSARNQLRGRDYQFPLLDLFRQSLYGRRTRYEDTSSAPLRRGTAISEQPPVVPDHRQDQSKGDERKEPEDGGRQRRPRDETNSGPIHV
jgi:hypothetical protein